jgi:hypothetical protein
MPGLLELEQEDLRDLEGVAGALLSAGSSLEAGPAFDTRAFAEGFARFAEETVAMALGFAARLRARWEQYQRAGHAGHASEVHALRDSLLASFEARLRHLEQAKRIADRASALIGRAVPESERLPGAVKELTALKDEIFSRWRALEDLEQMLVETYPLSAEQFDTLAKHLRPPQEWLHEEVQPFKE